MRIISLLLVSALITLFFGSVAPVLGDEEPPIIVVDGIGDEWDSNMKIADDVNESDVPDGYDIKALYQYYDGREGWDTLYFRYDVYGIAGDSDDDGDPHNSTQGHFYEGYGVGVYEFYYIFLDTDLDNSTGWTFTGVEGGFDVYFKYNNNNTSLYYTTPQSAFLVPGEDGKVWLGYSIVEGYLNDLLVRNGDEEDDRVTAAINCTPPYYPANHSVVEIGVSDALDLFTLPAGPRNYRVYGYANIEFDPAPEDFLGGSIDIRAPNLNFNTSDICCYNVSFNGTSAPDDLVNCTWEFGDGNRTTCDSPCMNTTHQYAAGGFYKVNFSGNRTNGMYGFTQKTIYVDMGPTIIAHSNVTEPLGVPSWVALNGSGSYCDPNGTRTISRWEWTFDDWHEPLNNATEIIFVNTTVNATLSVFDGHCTNTTDNETTLRIIYKKTPLNLNFTTDDICCFNQSFNATTNATLANCTWEFGDGTSESSCKMNTTHQYTHGGNFTVIFSGCREDNGAYGSITKTIYVDRGPEATARANVTYISEPTMVEFNGSKSHPDTKGNRNISRYEWEFGDGIDLSGKVVTREINQTTIATLTVFDMSTDGIEHCNEVSSVKVTMGAYPVPASSNIGIMILITLIAIIGAVTLQRRRIRL